MKQTQDIGPVPNGRRQLAAVLAVSLGTMVTSIDNGVMSLALPTLARDLQVTPSEAVMVVTVFQLVLIMAVLPLSALGQRLGFRRLYQGGLFLFMVSTLACFFAGNLPLLMAVRAVQALGAAATYSVSAALIRAIYPPARLGSGLALNTVVASTSASLAPSLGGAVLSFASWPWLFAITLPFAGISLLAGRSALPDPPTGQILPYDCRGAVLCAAMFGLSVVGLEALVRGVSLALCGLALATALLIGRAFVVRERVSVQPMLPVDLLSRRPIALAAAAGLLANLGAMQLQLSLPFRLQHKYGLSPGETGMILAAWPIATMIVAPSAGILSDRTSPMRLCMLGMAVAATGLVTLAWLPVDRASHFDMVWRIALTAAGFGLFYSPNARFVIGLAAQHRTAAAGALTQVTRMSGQILGSTMAAALFALDEGHDQVPALLAAALAVGVLALAGATTMSGRSKAGMVALDDVAGEMGDDAVSLASDRG